jgi:hypothetical protein
VHYSLLGFNRFGWAANGLLQKHAFFGVQQNARRICFSMCIQTAHPKRSVIDLLDKDRDQTWRSISDLELEIAILTRTFSLASGDQTTKFPSFESDLQV